MEMIATDPMIVNTLNENFSVVCLATDEAGANLDLQRTRFKTSSQPYFAVLTSSNDSLINSFNFEADLHKMDSILISTLY